MFSWCLGIYGRIPCPNRLTRSGPEIFCMALIHRLIIGNNSIQLAFQLGWGHSFQVILRYSFDHNFDRPPTPIVTKISIKSVQTIFK